MHWFSYDFGWVIGFLIGVLVGWFIPQPKALVQSWIGDLLRLLWTSVKSLFVKVFHL